MFEETNSIEALDGVFKSDTIVPEALRLSLIDAIKPLEDVPEDRKDWHPGSNRKVLDLVHPSIYPLVYGKTCILPKSTVNLEEWQRHFGVGEELQSEQDISGRREWSTRFQWLPCDVDISHDDVKITSYINNLHPEKHRRLYSIIERVISKSLSLWKQTLSRVRDSRKPRIKHVGDGYGEASEPEPVQPNHDGTQPSMADWDAYSVQETAWKNSRPVIQPEPNPFLPNDYNEPVGFSWRSTGTASCNHKIQVIVKLASIYLTPDSPNYDGGSWHVEGAGNENICASAIYYYESENISESLLSFRQHVVDQDMELEYEQDDHRALETIFGFENDSARIQNLGSVVTRQGRMITFPNIMQHRVNPFHLEDPTKSGHRKILALFLVDPHQRIISTANVPPQQAEWWQEHFRLVDQVNPHLPQELNDHIRKELRQPTSMEVAKEQRLALMEERTAFAEQHSDAFENEGESFSLCEH